MKSLIFLFAAIIASPCFAQFKAGELNLVEEQVTEHGSRLDNLEARLANIEAKLGTCLPTAAAVISEPVVLAAAPRRIVCSNGNTCRSVTTTTTTQPAVSTVVQASRPVAVWKGRTYTGRVCNLRNCDMCNSITQQIQRQTAPVVSQSTAPVVSQSTAPVQASRNCSGGNCTTTTTTYNYGRSGWYPGKWLFGR